MTSVFVTFRDRWTRLSLLVGVSVFLIAGLLSTSLLLFARPNREAYEVARTRCRRLMHFFVNSSIFLVLVGAVSMRWGSWVNLKFFPCLGEPHSGRSGHSSGCPAVVEDQVEHIIGQLQGGNLVYIHTPFRLSYL